MTDSRRSTALALLVAGAFFMENLDGTVIATALPQMAKSFNVPVLGLSIGITAYLLALAVFVPMSGWITDRYGARTIFASAIAVFTLSSVLCGFARSVPEFTAARVIQGIGGAMMVPVGRLVVLRNTEKRELVRAIALITWPGLAAPILGPPIGGIITDHANWRWIFFLNVPLGIIALVLAMRMVPNIKADERPPFDWLGFVLTGMACLFITVGLDRVTDPQSKPLEIVGLVFVGFTLGVFAVRHLKKAEHPLVKFEALKVPTFAIMIWGNSLFRFAISAVPFLLPILFQVGFGLSATNSGMLVLWVFAGNLAMKPATTWVLRKFGFRNVLLGNGLLAALSLITIAAFSPSTPYPIMAGILFAGGLFRSMQFTAANTLGFSDVPPAQMTGANVLLSTIGGLTSGVGPAIGAIALHCGSWFRHAENTTPTLWDFHIAFVIVGLIALASLYDAFPLPANAGEEVSGYHA